jgi:hypothetical protein
MLHVVCAGEFNGETSWLVADVKLMTEGCNTIG